MKHALTALAICCLVLTPVLSAEAWSNGTSSASETERPKAPVESNAPDTRGIKSGASAWKATPEELATAASGELALVSIDAVPSIDLSTVTFQDLCVRNYRGTPANEVWV